MSYQLEQAEGQGFWLWWRTSVRTLAIALSGGVAGATLVALAWRFGDSGPSVLVGIALVPFILVLTFNDARVATTIVFFSFVFGFTAVTIYVFDFRLNLQAVDIAILITTVLVITQRLAVREVAISWSAPLWCILFLVVWAVVSMTSAADQTLALKQVGSLATGLVFATTIFSLCREMRDIRFICSGLVAVATLLVLPALAEVGELRTFYGGSVIEGRLTGIFLEPNELGLFAAVTSLLAGGLLLGARGMAKRLGYSVALLILLLGLTLSLSRGAWLGAGAGILVMLLTIRVARRILLLVGIPLLIVGFLVANLAPSHPNVKVVGERLGSLVDINQPYDERPAIYAEALRQIRDDPWTGQGPGNFSIAAQRLATGGIVVTATHAHNSYLNIAAELGLPALLAIVLFILWAGLRGRHAIRALRSDERLGDAAMIAGVAAAMAAYAFTGFVNNFLGNPIIEPTMWACVGALLGAYRIVRRTGNDSRRLG